jgi:hypothetical protein
MTDEGRIKITLPLPASEREALGAWLTEYVKVRDAAYAEYDKAENAAWAEYDKVRDAAWAEYDKVRVAAWAEYVKVRDAARAEYDKVRDAARAEYVKSENASPLAAWIIETHFADYEGEARVVLRALHDGASWQDLHEQAEAEEWCVAWDDAVLAARERFEIS